MRLGSRGTMRPFSDRVLIAVLGAALVTALTAGVADPRSIRQSYGFMGDHTHVTWAGPDVGLITWTSRSIS